MSIDTISSSRPETTSMFLALHFLHIKTGPSMIQLCWHEWHLAVAGISSIFNFVSASGVLSVAAVKQNRKLSGTTQESLPIRTFTCSIRVWCISSGTDDFAVSIICITILISCIYNAPFIKTLKVNGQTTYCFAATAAAITAWPRDIPPSLVGTFECVNTLKPASFNDRINSCKRMAF
jgi:hypothetical protein